MRTGEFIDVLRRAGLPVEAMEVAEALWLASTAGTLAPAATEEAVPQPRIRRPPKRGPALPSSAGPPGPDPGAAVEDPDPLPTGQPVLDPGAESVPLTLPAAGERAVTEVTGRAFLVPTGPTLPDRGALLRALRPLKRRIDSRRDEVLDEDATAQRIAGGGPPSPVLRPAQERWLDAVVVVDSAPSMDLWAGTAGELRSVLRQLGAFRDIRLWRMVHDGNAGLGVTPYGAATHLDLGVRSGSELIDFSGRRLFLVFTDATSQAWRDGSAGSLLAAWSARGFVVIVQPLPERLWSRTGLHVRNGTFVSFRPGTFTGEQTFVERRRRPRELAAVERPVPVVELRPAWMASWSRTVAGATDGGIELAAAIITSEPSARAAPPAEGVPDDAETLVGQFFATASPDACRLAVCLAAVPLDLHVIHLVQRAMVPASGPTHVAEVLLSGLLRRVANGSAALHRFDFRPRVRGLLLDELRVSEMRQVLDLVSDYVTTHGGFSDATFGAVAAVAGGSAAEVVARPFAWIPYELVERLEPRTPVPPPGQVPTGDGSGEEPADLVPGVTVDHRYRLDEQIGGGRTGDLWRATDLQLSQTVAVKVSPAELFPDAAATAAFHRRAQAVGRIEHPGVVRVHGSGTIAASGAQYVVMQHLDGSDLSEILGPGEQVLAAGSALLVIAQAAEALAAVHEQGLVHGDVDPVALRVLSSGRVVLTGFRFARPAARGTVRAELLVGDAEYISPEHSRSEPQPSSDVYSLGVVGYRCLAGQPPFTGLDALEVIQKHLRELPPLLPAYVPPEARTLISGTLRKAPAERPAARALAAEAWVVLNGPGFEGVRTASGPFPPVTVRPGPDQGFGLLGEPRADRPGFLEGDTEVLPEVPVRGAPPYYTDPEGPDDDQPPADDPEQVARAEQTLVERYPPAARRFLRGPLTAATIMREILAVAERGVEPESSPFPPVPNRFTVSLAPPDHEHFVRLLPPIEEAFAGHLARVFRVRGWYPAGTVTVGFVADDLIRSPQVSVIADSVPGGGIIA
ncbi:FhaA domain-containing protein [Actinoplanes sp. HUAS TT8]|uniref:FhaA domain-containing protein n=1 Tax=Actinoplanes sp. HUAS TT8 TaxID=3447453 RepID=UPI003F524434